MADFEAQFELLSTVQSKLNETVLAINRIRAMRRRLDDWSDRLGEADRLGQDHEGAESVPAAIEAVGERLTEIEEELVQPEFTSEGDTLNYREKLFEKLSGLRPVVSSADTAPTKQSHQVYDKLAGQIDEQLGALDELVQGDLADLNVRLAELSEQHRGDGLGIIGA